MTSPRRHRTFRRHLDRPVVCLEEVSARLRAELLECCSAADSVRFVLTLNADPRDVCRYNLSVASHNARNSRVTFGRAIAPDYRDALWQIAARTT
jgi:hypothetical protein